MQNTVASRLLLRVHRVLPVVMKNSHLQVTTGTQYSRSRPPLMKNTVGISTVMRKDSVFKLGYNTVSSGLAQRQNIVDNSPLSGGIRSLIL